MRHQRHTLLVAALAIAVIAVVPGGAVAADGLSVTGDQADDGTVTVTVTENNTSVANASVTVEALDNATYNGSGDYVTDENGTVTLPAPAQNVSVSVTATANNTTAETTLDLVAPTEDTSELGVDVTQAEDGSATVAVTNGSAGVANASVTVDALNNSSYEGAGDYVTDENGTVGLPAPEENVSVSVTATANNQTASTTATLTVGNESDDGEQSFGERVSSFVHQLQTEGNMSGQTVSAFVVSNNPGADNRPDHAGPPHADDDEDDQDDQDDERGNGNGADGNNGNGNGADGANDNSDDGNDDGNNGNGNDDGNNGNGNGGNGNNGNGNGGPP